MEFFLVFLFLKEINFMICRLREFKLNFETWKGSQIREKSSQIWIPDPGSKNAPDPGSESIRLIKCKANNTGNESP
jgi:hypothetical protein